MKNTACSHRSPGTKLSSVFWQAHVINYAIILLVRIIRNGNGACDSLFPVFSYEILRSKKTENAEKPPSTGESAEASRRCAKKAEETANTTVSTSILVAYVPAN